MFYIDKGTDEGAELVADGNRIERNGFYIEPTLFSASSDDRTIVRDETSVPCSSRCPTSRSTRSSSAPATEFGLAAGVLTRNLSSAHQFAAKVKAGIV